MVADLLEGSEKIAGAAQRKTRQGLLHQGSIQRNDLPLEFRPLFARRLGDNICERPVNSAVLEHAKTLATDKYDTLEWLRRL